MSWLSALQRGRISAEDISFATGFYGTKLEVIAPRKPEKAANAKCPGCGSFEYRYHNMVRICSYCRTGQ